jgi:hypothetical protein
MTDVPTQEKKILSIVLPSMVEAENFSEHPRTVLQLSKTSNVSSVTVCSVRVMFISSATLTASSSFTGRDAFMVS